MVKIDQLELYEWRQIYKKLFKESAEDSKEFLIFVLEENVHPLRQKVENYIDNKIDEIFLKDKNGSKSILLKQAYILDSLIMNYIDNHE
jgi:hypothetical protein